MSKVQEKLKIVLESATTIVLAIVKGEEVQQSTKLLSNYINFL